MTFNLFIHAGPYKTGSTSIQNWLYANRNQLAKHQWLYPETGITAESSLWGRRHLYIFREDTEKSMWDKLNREITHSEASNIILSAERLCARIPLLLSFRDHYIHYNPKLVVFVRDEVELLKSWYLQLIKSRSFKGKSLLSGKKLRSFDEFFLIARDTFNYSKIASSWASINGYNSIIFIPYLKDSSYDCISAFTSAVGIPFCNSTNISRSNRSLKPFSAFLGLAAARRGYSSEEITKIIAAATEIELDNKFLDSWPIQGFNQRKIRQYYEIANESLMNESPEFAKAYKDALT
jgi:hypothetical protein